MSKRKISPRFKLRLVSILISNQEKMSGETPQIRKKKFDVLL